MKKPHKGFTLIETLVAIFLFTLMFGVLSALIVYTYGLKNYAFEQAQAVGDARRIVEQMTREMREATTGADGAYVLERADEYEIVFFSDIDQDDEVERVRYFINPAGGNIGSLTDTCVSFVNGGSCSVVFSGFLTDALKTASAQVAVEGDLDAIQEYATITIDGNIVGNLCNLSGECTQCSGAYEDLTTFNVTSSAQDDFLTIVGDGSQGNSGSRTVNNICNWQNPNHSLKMQVRLDWEELAPPQAQAVFRKGTTDPTGFPSLYQLDQETLSSLSQYVVNEGRGLPVFTYYDENDDVIADPLANIQNITRVHVNMIINVDLNRAPDDFSLETDVHLRNLKKNL